MERKEIREILGDPEYAEEAYERWGIQFPDKDCWFESCLQIRYNKEERIEDIQASAHPSFLVTFDSVPINESPIESVDKVIAQASPLDKTAKEDPYTYWYPEIGVSLWREHLEKNCFDTINLVEPKPLENKARDQIAGTRGASDSTALRYTKMKRILLALLFLCCSSNTYAKFEVGLTLDPAYKKEDFTAWLGYLLARKKYVEEHLIEYNLREEGDLIPRFNEELYAYNAVADIWKNLKKNDAKYESEFFDDIQLIHESGYMAEYLWVNHWRNGWVKPDELRLEDYAIWEIEKLKEHVIVYCPGKLTVGTR